MDFTVLFYLFWIRLGINKVWKKKSSAPFYGKNKNHYILLLLQTNIFLILYHCTKSVWNSYLGENSFSLIMNEMMLLMLLMLMTFSSRVTPRRSQDTLKKLTSCGIDNKDQWRWSVWGQRLHSYTDTGLLGISVTDIRPWTLNANQSKRPGLYRCR